jgi:hypothetical protein
MQASRARTTRGAIPRSISRKEMNDMDEKERVVMKHLSEMADDMVDSLGDVVKILEAWKEQADALYAFYDDRRDDRVQEAWNYLNRIYALADELRPKFTNGNPKVMP